MRIIVVYCLGTRFKDKQTTFGPSEASWDVLLPSSVLLENYSTKPGVEIKWTFVWFLEIYTSEEKKQGSCLICIRKGN